MNPLVALGVLLAAVTPAAQATEPPTIVEVHSQSRVCSAIEERVGPSVAALLQNDRTILDGLAEMRRMGMDAGTLQQQMDELHLENDVSRIVRNLAAIDALLAQPESPEVKGDDAQKIQAMKESLRAVAGLQRATLNDLDGSLESAQAAQFTDMAAIPKFANVDQIQQASANGNFHVPVTRADKRVARTEPLAPGPDVSPSPPPPPRSVADFYPALARSEAGAGHIVSVAATGCARLNVPP